MAEQPRPTQADVFAWKEQRKRVLGPMHDRMRVADEWLHADEQPSPIVKYINRGVPAGHNWSVFPYAWTVLNRGVNQVHTAEVPQVTYELPAEYKRRYKNAADDEKACQQALQSIIYRAVTGSTENPFLDGLHQQLGLGQGCLSYHFDYDRLPKRPDHAKGTPEEEEAWETWERLRAEVLPWRIESLHPTWVLPDIHNDPPQDFIIERPVSLADMAERFPKLGLDSTTAGGSGSEPTAKYVEYVSREWYGCWVNAMPVTEVEGADEDGIAPNTLGHVWYSNFWSGLGKKDEFGSWNRRGVGMIQRGISEFAGLTFDDNWLDIIKRSYMPKYLAKGPTAELAAEATADIDPLSGAVAALPDGISFGPMDGPEVPEALIQDKRDRQQRIEQLYGPGLLSGTYHSEPASKMAARMEAARGPYRVPKKNIEQAVATMLGDILWDIKHEPDLADGYHGSYEQGKGQDRRRYAVYLKPSQIHPGGKITVDFSPPTPEDKAFKVEDARAKQEYHWISAETAMKAGAEVEDTVEEMAQIMADQVMATPEFIGFQTQIAIQALQSQYGAPMAPAAQMGPAGAADAGMGLEPLPPGVPQEPGPPLGSDLAAMEQAQTMQRSVFRPPQMVTGY